MKTHRISKSTFLEKYGNVEVVFSNYYKYTFTFSGKFEGNRFVVSVGGTSSDIYRYSVSALPITIMEVIDCYGLASADVYDVDGNLICFI